jgi:hypothetical protein
MHYDAAVRRRARDITLALLCSFCVAASATGCRRASRGDDERLEARQAASLAWVNALAAGDAATLERLTAGSFIFRSAGPDRRCEGPVSGGPALAAWVACARATTDLRQLSDAWTLLHGATPGSPESAEFQKYLPHVVGGDEAWSRFIGVDEREHVRPALDAITKEARRDGDWILVATSWLYAKMFVRLQVVGPTEAPWVHAALVDVMRTSD